MQEHGAKLYCQNDEKPHQQLMELCHRYRVMVSEETEIPEGGALVFNKGRVYYQIKNKAPVTFELERNYEKIIQQKNRGKSAGPLYKALGKNSKVVVDATCGSTVDSMFMLAMGMEVYAFERNPLVAFLIDESLLFHELQQNEFSKILKHFHFQFGDVTDHLESLPKVDAVYFDPMFPEKKKSSALARKEMELFKDLVGKDSDEAEVLELLLTLSGVRIIVKRPVKEKAIKSSPVASFTGKTTRYDLYKN